MRLVDSQGKPVADCDSHELTIEMIVTPGVSKFAPFKSTIGRLWEAADMISSVDRMNHWTSRMSDEEGRFTVPALIPGATYSLTVSLDGELAVTETFTTKAGETLDLGDIVMDRPD